MNRLFFLRCVRNLFLLIALLSPAMALAQQAALPIHPGATTSVSGSTSPSAAALVTQASNPSWQLELYNSGSVSAFCKFGGSTVSAAVTDYPIGPGIDKIITVDQDRKYISCITASSTTTVYVTGGVGQ